MTDAKRELYRLNVGEIDWLTLTTFEGSAYIYWTEILERRFKDIEEHKIMQYDGKFGRRGNGTMFVGDTSMNGKDHIMLRVSGAAAHDLFPELSRGIKEGWCKATRIDVQITTVEPPEWSQWRLFNRLKKRGLTTSMVGKSGSETVYVGSRSSERVTRIYEKWGRVGGTEQGDRKLIRWETEYKGDRAARYAREIAKDGRRIGEYLAYEMQVTVNDRKAQALFAEHLTGEPKTEKIPVVRGTGKTENWLIKTCLPAFSKVINSHESDGRVMAAFIDEIQRCVSSGNRGASSYPIYDDSDE